MATFYDNAQQHESNEICKSHSYIVCLTSVEGEKPRPEELVITECLLPTTKTRLSGKSRNPLFYIIYSVPCFGSSRNIIREIIMSG